LLNNSALSVLAAAGENFTDRFTWNVPTNYVHTSTKAKLRRLAISADTGPLYPSPF